MPVLRGILESCLYCDDLERACRFYAGTMGLRQIFEQEGRIAVFEVQPTQVLILFRRGGSVEPSPSPGGLIPPHDGSGPVHLAFSVEEDDLADWRDRLAKHGVAIESEVSWDGRGHSIYFRDPDDHALELVTPRLWSSLDGR